MGFRAFRWKGAVSSRADVPPLSSSHLPRGGECLNVEHPPPYVDFVPSSPESESGVYMYLDADYSSNPPDPVWTEIARLDERISWVNANVGQPLYDEIVGLH